MSALYAWADMSGDGQDFDGHHFTSLREARASLRDYLSGAGVEAVAIKRLTIERLEIGNVTLSLVLQILNGEGYVHERTAVESWEAKICGRCDHCKNEEPWACAHKRVKRST